MSRPAVFTGLPGLSPSPIPLAPRALADDSSARGLQIWLPPLDRWSGSMLSAQATA